MSEEEVTPSLRHFGVKGMQWGKRKAEGSAGGGGKAKIPRPTTQAILAAREERDRRTVNLMAADLNYSAAVRSGKKNVSDKALQKAVKDVLDTSNNELADTMTRGEKVALNISAGVVGLVILSSIRNVIG